MSLIICPECGGKLSDKADFCPHCGYNQLKQRENINDTNIEKNSNSFDEYANMSEEELNLLVVQYIVEIYPQLFGKDATPQHEYCKTLDNIFNALEKLNSENEFLLINRKYEKIPYLHLALYLTTFDYIAISKNTFDNLFDDTFSYTYDDIGLHLEFMSDDFGEVLVLDEKYNDFIKFSSVYNKIRSKEKNFTNGNYSISQYGSPIDAKIKLNIPQVSLHLGDFCLVDRDVEKNTIEEIVWHPIPPAPKEASLVKNAIIGSILGGSAGALIGIASGIEQNSKIQAANNNYEKYHIRYIDDDSYVVNLLSNIVWGAMFSFLINNRRANYIKFNNIIYEKIGDLHKRLNDDMTSAQQFRQQMYAWVTKYNDVNGFEANSDESLECMKSYNPDLYTQLLKEITEKKQADLIEKEKKKKKYIIRIEEKEKEISEWQNKYDLYKNKIFGEGKRMKDYSYSQLLNLQEEKKCLEEELAKLDDK